MSHKNTDDTLWHYTTFETLIKIITQGQLLASNYQFLNDSSEMQTGVSIFKRWLIQHPNPDIQKLGHDKRFLYPFDIFNWPYVLSFSSARDSLSMWRGYGNAAHGNNGVAIGFSRAALEALLMPTIFDDLLKCKYGEASFSRKLDAIFEKFDANAPKFTIFGDVMKAIPQAKNIHFEEEHEWRMLGCYMQHKDNHLLTEISGKYRLRFNLNQLHPDGRAITEHPLAIAEIMAGPKTDVVHLKHFLEMSLSIKELAPPLITKSEIPFV